MFKSDPCCNRRNTLHDFQGKNTTTRQMSIEKESTVSTREEGHPTNTWLVDKNINGYTEPSKNTNCKIFPTCEDTSESKSAAQDPAALFKTKLHGQRDNSTKSGIAVINPSEEGDVVSLKYESKSCAGESPTSSTGPYHLVPDVLSSDDESDDETIWSSSASHFDQSENKSRRKRHIEEIGELRLHEKRPDKRNISLLHHIDHSNGTEQKVSLGDGKSCTNGMPSMRPLCPPSSLRFIGCPGLVPPMETSLIDCIYEEKKHRLNSFVLKSHWFPHMSGGVLGKKFEFALETGSDHPTDAVVLTHYVHKPSAPCNETPQ